MAATTGSVFAAMLEESFIERAPAEGSVVKGHIVSVENDFVVVDVGLKTEGRVPLKEFSMPGVPANVKVGDQVEVFVERVENALGENFQEFVEASQGVNERGCRMLRVVAIGMSNELSIQWNYYHLSNSEGRQAAMVFTCESDLVERMRDQDRAIAMSFEFTAPIETALAKTSTEKADSASTSTESAADKKSGADTTGGNSQLAAEASPSDLDSTPAGQGKTIGNLAIPKPTAGAKTTGSGAGKTKSVPAGKAAARGPANGGSKKSKR